MLTIQLEFILARILQTMHSTDAFRKLEDALQTMCSILDLANQITVKFDSEPRIYNRLSCSLESLNSKT